VRDLFSFNFYSELLGLWALSIVRNCKHNTMFQKLDLLLPSGGWGGGWVKETITLLGLFERTNLNHWSSGTQQSRRLSPLT
jgi:hypothetical protein